MPPTSQTFRSLSAMWFKDRPRFLCIITLHLSKIANYFVIITERLSLIQRRSNMAVKLTRNEHDLYHGNIGRTSTKTQFLDWEKIVEGRVWLVTAVNNLVASQRSQMTLFVSCSVYCEIFLMDQSFYSVWKRTKRKIIFKDFIPWWETAEFAG